MLSFSVLLLNGNYSRAVSLLLKRQTPITSTCREMFTEKKDDNTQQIRYTIYSYLSQNFTHFQVGGKLEERSGYGVC